MASNFNTPTPSGRSTPINFKDLVSFLQVCTNPLKHVASLLGAFAWGSVQPLQSVNEHLLTIEHPIQIQDSMKAFKHEHESEAHQVCSPSLSPSSTPAI